MSAQIKHTARDIKMKSEFLVFNFFWNHFMATLKLSPSNCMWLKLAFHKYFSSHFEINLRFVYGDVAISLHLRLSCSSALFAIKKSKSYICSRLLFVTLYSIRTFFLIVVVFGSSHAQRQTVEHSILVLARKTFCSRLLRPFTEMSAHTRIVK